jgi:hypothetical protein
MCLACCLAHRMQSKHCTLFRHKPAMNACYATAISTVDVRKCFI